MTRINVSISIIYPLSRADLLIVVEGTEEKLSQVAVKGAEYNSPERHPHPKCLEGTFSTMLDH